MSTENKVVPMNNAPQLAKAVLIPMVDNEPDRDEANHIQVQFNPESLKVTLSNSLKADTQGGANGPAAQYIEKSESSLSVELLFDTSAAATHHAALIHNCASSGGDTQAPAGDPNGASSQAMDVRSQTKCIADRFMKSPDDAESTGRPSAPARCRFQWGSFVFVGMLSSYNETLEYFSPEGIPLRAKLSLSLKEDRYQFEQLDIAAAQREQPTLSPAADNLPQTLANQRKDPKSWRDAALFNGIENPRLGLSLEVSLPKVELKASAGVAASANFGVGFKAGASTSLGTSVPGAFVEVKPPSVELKAGVAAGASASLNTGSGINASAGTSATAGASLQGAQPSIRLRS